MEELDSPEFKPDSLKEFEYRKFIRINRNSKNNQDNNKTYTLEVSRCH